MLDCSSEVPLHVWCTLMWWSLSEPFLKRLKSSAHSTLLGRLSCKNNITPVLQCSRLLQNTMFYCGTCCFTTVKPCGREHSSYVLKQYACRASLWLLTASQLFMGIHFLYIVDQVQQGGSVFFVQPHQCRRCRSTGPLRHYIYCSLHGALCRRHGWALLVLLPAQPSNTSFSECVHGQTFSSIYASCGWFTLFYS